MKYHYGGLGIHNPFADIHRIQDDDDTPDDDFGDDPTIESEDTETTAQREAREEDEAVADALAQHEKGTKDYRDVVETRENRNRENREKADAMRARRKGGGTQSDDPLDKIRSSAKRLAESADANTPSIGDTIIIAGVEYEIDPTPPSPKKPREQPQQYLRAKNDHSQRIYIGHGANKGDGYIVNERTWYELHGKPGMEPEDLDKRVVIVPSKKLQYSSPGKSKKKRKQTWEVIQKDKYTKQTQEVRKKPKPKWGDKAQPLDAYKKQMDENRRQLSYADSPSSLDKVNGWLTGHWLAQHEEAMEQLRRRKKHFQSGDYSYSAKLWNDDGKFERKPRPDAKGDIGIGSKTEKVYHSNQWELIDQDHASRYKPDQIEFTLTTQPNKSTRDVYAKEDQELNVKTMEVDDVTGEQKEVTRKSTVQKGEKLSQAQINAMEKFDDVDVEDTSEGRLKSFLTDRGLTGADIDLVKAKDGTFTYRVTTAQGNRINPDLAERIAYDLDERFGVAREKDKLGREQILFERKGAPMRRKRHIGGKHEEPPKWVDREGTNIDRTAGGRVSAQFGDREKRYDGSLGDLKPGQKDTLSVGVKLPFTSDSQRLYWNLQERSDAVGWGTSWRPGEKEVNQTLLAGARWNALADQGELASRNAELQHELNELPEKAPEGEEKEHKKKKEELHSKIDDLNDSMDAYIQKRHPDADEEEVNHIRREIYDLGAAGASASAYKARKAAGNHGIYEFVKNRDPKDRLWLQRTHLLPVVDEAYVRPLGQKIDRFFWRMQHPTHDPLRPHVAPFEWNIVPEFPSIRYRRFATFKSEDEITKGRLERQAHELRAGRRQIQEAMEKDPTELGWFQRAHRTSLLRTSRRVVEKSHLISKKLGGEDLGYLDEDALSAIRDQPHLYGKAHYQEQPIHKHADLVDIERAEKVARRKLQEHYTSVKGGNKTMAADSHLRYAVRNLRTVLVKKRQLEELHKASPVVHRITKVVDSGAAHSGVAGPSGKALKSLGKAGVYGAGIAAIAGIGIYGYDKYKTHEIDSGRAAANAKSGSIIPETVTIPKWEMYAAKKTKIPHNTWTSALDIEDKTMPLLPGIRYKPKTYRLRNHVDISGERYKPGPLVGNLKFTGPGKNDGSWLNSLAYKQREEGAGRYMQKASTVKNQYAISVGGTKLPITAMIGKKERWKDVPKNQRLKSKNPNKLTMDDRQAIAMGIISGNNNLRYEYGDDPKIMEMVNDPDQRDKVVRKIDYVYAADGKPVQHVAMQDPETGHWSYQPTASTRAGGVPIQHGAYHMSPGQVESVQTAYHEEARRQQEAFHSAVGHTRTQTRTGGVVDATGTKVSNQGALEIKDDSLVPTTRERVLREEDKRQEKYNPNNPLDPDR